MADAVVLGHLQQLTSAVEAVAAQQRAQGRRQALVEAQIRELRGLVDEARQQAEADAPATAASNLVERLSSRTGQPRYAGRPGLTSLGALETAMRQCADTMHSQGQELKQSIVRRPPRLAERSLSPPQPPDLPQPPTGWLQKQLGAVERKLEALIDSNEERMLGQLEASERRLRQHHQEGLAANSQAVAEARTDILQAARRLVHDEVDAKLDERWLSIAELRNAKVRSEVLSQSKALAR